MKQEGAITRWDDARGFGFITPQAGGSPVFVHVSALPRGARPGVGTAVTFFTTRDDRNRLRATDVAYVGSSTPRTPAGRGVPLAGTVSAAFLGLVGVLAALKVVPGPVVLIFLLMSVIAFVLYRADKSAAKQGSWRVPESRLHLVSLLGGWPGALLAQQIYHHKTRKQSFQTVFWITVVVNCAVLAWVAFGRPLEGL